MKKIKTLKNKIPIIKISMKKYLEWRYDDLPVYYKIDVFPVLERKALRIKEAKGYFAEAGYLPNFIILNWNKIRRNNNLITFNEHIEYGSKFEIEWKH